MRDGLRKGTETCKENAKTFFIEYVCPNCHKTMYLKPWQIKNRIACSIKCAAALNKERNDVHLHNLNLKHQEEYQVKCSRIKELVAEWCNNNKNIITSCPLNKIITNLQPMITEVERQYGVKDIRSIMLCFGITSRKEFIKYLRQLINK